VELGSSEIGVVTDAARAIIGETYTIENDFVAERFNYATGSDRGPYEVNAVYDLLVQERANVADEFMRVIFRKISVGL